MPKGKGKAAGSKAAGKVEDKAVEKAVDAAPSNDAAVAEVAKVDKKEEPKR
jgi:hypothetical protein